MYGAAYVMTLQEQMRVNKMRALLAEREAIAARRKARQHLARILINRLWRTEKK